MYTMDLEPWRWDWLRSNTKTARLVKVRIYFKAKSLLGIWTNVKYCCDYSNTNKLEGIICQM